MKNETIGLLYMEKAIQEGEAISKDLQLKLIKNELQWEDDKVQFFIPVILSRTDFDWLKLIAEHHCIEEDEKIIKNFLDMCESLRDVNSNALKDSVIHKMKKRFK